MVAEIYPRMTSLIKNSKWRRDLLKGCIGPTSCFPFHDVLTFTFYLFFINILNKQVLCIKFFTIERVSGLKVFQHAFSNLNLRLRRKQSSFVKSSPFLRQIVQRPC